ncbi:sugar ABC transporter permease, partial [Enterococcus faecium]
MNAFTKYWNRPDRAAFLFLTPSFFVLFLFTVIPLLGTYAISFTDLNIFFTSRNFVCFENFTRIYSDERAVNSLIPSLY